MLIVTLWYQRVFMIAGEHPINTRMGWFTMRDSNEDSNDNTGSGADDKLALELLTEEERRYFAGKKQNSIIKKILSSKRKANESDRKNLADDYSIKAAVNINDFDKQQPPSKLNIKETSPFLNKKGRGLQLLTVSIILTSLVVVAVFFTLKTTGYLATTEDFLSIDSELPADQRSIAEQTVADEALINNSDVAIDNVSVIGNKQLVTEEDSSNKSNNDIDSLSNATLGSANAQNQSAQSSQTSKPNEAVINEPTKEQNDNSSSVSYEDFEKESQRTLYRDEDY